jgi:hypothetical protein
VASDGGSEGLRIVACGPERAGDVHRLTQLAFAPHAALDPPSGAGKETVERVRENLAAGGGASTAASCVCAGSLSSRADSAGESAER